MKPTHKDLFWAELKKEFGIMIFRLMYLMAFFFITNQVFRWNGIDLYTTSVWWDIVILCVAILIYNIIFVFTGIKIHVTNRSGVIKSTISGNFFQWRRSKR